MAVSPNMYELTYIVNAVISDDQIKDIIKRITAYLKESGAEIIEVDEWGSRRLAYPIQKKRNGYYVNVYFRSSGDFIPRLERVLEIDDNVLRYLTLRLDARMIRYYESNQDSRARLAGRGGDEAEADSRKTSSRTERKAPPTKAETKEPEVVETESVLPVEESSQEAPVEAVADAAVDADSAGEPVADADSVAEPVADADSAGEPVADADSVAEPAVDADSAGEPAAEESTTGDSDTGGEDTEESTSKETESAAS
jgi:small subunit ribosomal protein S6